MSKAHLTRRERQVCKCLVDGLSDKGTARRLGIAEETVGFHYRNIFRKLGLDRRQDLLIWCLTLREWE